MGLIVIIIFLTIDMIVISPVNSFGDFMFYVLVLLLNLYFIGVILTIIGRRKMKKITESEPDEDTFDIKIIDDSTAFENIDKGLKCPMCYTRNPMEAKFCRRCKFEFIDSLESNL